MEYAPLARMNVPQCVVRISAPSGCCSPLDWHSPRHLFTLTQVCSDYQLLTQATVPSPPKLRTTTTRKDKGGRYKALAPSILFLQTAHHPHLEINHQSFIAGPKSWKARGGTMVIFKYSASTVLQRKKGLKTHDPQEERSLMCLKWAVHYFKNKPQVLDYHIRIIPSTSTLNPQDPTCFNHVLLTLLNS